MNEKDIPKVWPEVLAWMWMNLKKDEIDSVFYQRLWFITPDEFTS